MESVADFEKELENAGDKLVVVDFFAMWCGPCKMIAPVISKLAEEMDNVIFIKVDVDEAEELAQQQGISAMPTFRLFKNKEKVDELMGANQDKLKEMIKKYQN